MSDSLTDFVVKRASSPAGPFTTTGLPNNGAVDKALRQWDDTSVDADPTHSPTGSWIYQLNETTNQNVPVPYNTVSIGNPGKLLFAKRYGTSANDELHCVALDSAGNILAGGNEWTLVKLDSSGNVIWQAPISGSGGGQHCTVFGVAVDSSNNVYATGQFSGGLDCGSGKTAQSVSGNHFNNDVFIAKFNSSGVCQWLNAYSGNDNGTVPRGAGIVIDHAGNILVIGQLSGTVNFGGGARTGSSVFILKLDSSGQHIWSIMTGGLTNGMAGGIAVDASNNVFITGGAVGGNMTIESTTINSNYFQIFLFKLDSSGHPVWGKGVGGDWYNQGTSVAINSDGNVAICGYFNRTVNFGGGNRTPPQSDGSDGFVAQYSGSDGHWLWDHQLFMDFFGTTTPIGPNGVCCDTQKNVLICGYFWNHINFGNGTLAPNSGNQDSFVAKYSVSGQLVFGKLFGGTAVDSSDGLALDSSANCYVVGQFSGPLSYDGSQTGVTTVDAYDSYLVKVAP